LIISIIVLIEGLLVFLLAGPATISGIGNIMAGTVQMFGLILVVLALIPIIFNSLETYNRNPDPRSKLVSRTSIIVVSICGIILAGLGIFAALNFGSVTISPLSILPIYVVAALVGLLFFFGLAIMIAKLLSFSEFKFTKMLLYVFGITIASEGVVVLGIAAPTYIEGVGWVLKRTVDFAAIQLIVVGLAILTLSLLSERMEWGSKILSYLRIVTAAIATIEGFAIMAFSTDITIEGIGGITARTVTIAGAQLGILGLGCLIMMGMRSNLSTPRLRKISNLTFVFLLLLIPVAALSPAFTF